MIDIGNTLWHADQKTGPKFLSQLSAALIRCERRYRTEVRSFFVFRRVCKMDQLNCTKSD